MLASTGGGGGATGGATDSVLIKGLSSLKTGGGGGGFGIFLIKGLSSSPLSNTCLCSIGVSHMLTVFNFLCETSLLLAHPSSCWALVPSTSQTQSLLGHSTAESAPLTS